VCGICGVVQVGGLPREVIAPARFDAMTDAMAHRGPDDRGVLVAPGVALGARRLSIVDVEGGHQPFASEDGRVWGMQNGELYNHGQLRRTLEGEGHRFRSRCDTEVLPHLYEQEGERLAERLHGKFAIAVWDERERRAVLARDRLGVKPLYWSQQSDLVVFASELKCLLASGLIQPRLDYEAIDAYLSFGFVPAPATPLAGVRKLLPGHRLVIEPAGVREECYWRYPQPRPDSPARPEREYADELLHLLRDAVRQRLMSDVPLGAMLSGGLDSSLIVALMAELSSEPVKTFSVGFREDADNSELADARHVAHLYGCDHHELELSFNNDTVNLPQLVWHLDEPLADLSALGFLALSKLARQHVTVALSGQGADELFAGYERHRNAALASRWRSLPQPVRAASEAVLRRGPRRATRVAEILSSADVRTRTLALYGRERRFIDALRSADSPLAASVDSAGVVVGRIAAGVADDDPLAATLYVDAQLALPDDMLHYFDRASMAHSLEVRVPFLDHQLVEWAATLPTELKIHGLTRKYLLKQIARPYLPPTIIDKRKIGFFRGTTGAWLDAQLSRAVDTYLLDGDPVCADFLSVDAVRSIVRDRARQPQLALSLLLLEIWLQTFMVGQRAEGRADETVAA
jgi:asparagine synthase (glutamine-hydrolysing)